MFQISSKLSVLFAFSLVFGFSAGLKAQIYLGNTQVETDLNALTDSIKPGTVLVIGEMQVQVG